MRRYESRYCTFGVPDDWEPQPPFGYVEPGAEEELMAAQAFEKWLEVPQPASQLAAQEKESLPHLLTDFELLSEGPARLPASTGDAYILDFRNLNEDREPVLTKKIFLTQGPLSVQFVLSRPAEGDDEKRARLAEQIAATLSFRDVAFLDRYTPLPLFAGSAGTAGDAPTRGEVQIDADAPRQDFPRCCVSLPVLPGWTLEDDGGAARYTNRSFTIRLDRPIGQENDAEAWFRERMERLQAAKIPLLGSGRGELPASGTPWAAMLFEESGERRWNTGTTPRLLQVYVEDRQPLLWSLTGPRDAFNDQLRTLEALITSAVFLEPERWETPTAEPWIDTVLTGPWTCEGPSLYFQMDRRLIVQTSQQENREPLSELQPSIITSVKSHINAELDHDEEALPGHWQGAPALRHKLDGKDHYGEPLSLRTFWLTHREALYSLVVLAPKPDAAQETFDLLLRGVHVADARPRV